MKFKAYDIWYNETIDEIFVGSWVKVPHLFFFKKDKYKVEFLDDKYIFLNKRKFMEENSVLIGRWGEYETN